MGFNNNHNRCIKSGVLQSRDVILALTLLRRLAPVVHLFLEWYFWVYNFSYFSHEIRKSKKKKVLLTNLFKNRTQHAVVFYLIHLV